jgi:hypothetical protein
MIRPHAKTQSKVTPSLTSIQHKITGIDFISGGNKFSNLILKGRILRRVMQNKNDKDQWVWVVVQDPGGNEQFVGQHDEQEDISFIPVFADKEAGQQGLLGLTRQPGHKYEVQAILREELIKDAAAGGFMIFLLNESGDVLEKIKP